MVHISSITLAKDSEYPECVFSPGLDQSLYKPVEENHNLICLKC